MTTKSKTIFSIEDRGGYYVTGFEDGALMGASIETLRQFQGTLMGQAIRLEEKIRSMIPADEVKAVAVSIGPDIKVVASADTIENGQGYAEAFSAALLMAVHECEIDGQPHGDWSEYE